MDQLKIKFEVWDPKTDEGYEKISNTGLVHVPEQVYVVVWITNQDKHSYRRRAPMSREIIGNTRAQLAFINSCMRQYRDLELDPIEF